MNISTAKQHRDYFRDKFLHYSKKVDELQDKERNKLQIKLTDRPLKNKEVAEMVGMTEQHLSSLKANAKTFSEWCEFFEAHVNGKYLNKFKRNYKNR